MKKPGLREAGPVQKNICRSGAFDDAQDDKQDGRADKGIDDCGDDPSADGKPKARQQPARKESSDHADDNIADQAETATLHDLASQPAGDETHKKKYEKTSNIHAFFSLSERAVRRG